MRMGEKSPEKKGWGREHLQMLEEDTQHSRESAFSLGGGFTCVYLPLQTHFAAL